MPDITSLFVFPFFLIFLRVGAAVMVFPGFSDSSLNTRTRLLVALLISFTFFPLLQSQMPTLPATILPFLTLVFGEIIVGIVLAFGARLFMAALNVAGELIAFMSGLQAASLFDPRTGSNTIAPAIFISIVAVTLIFAMDIHHLMIEGIIDSYSLFPPGKLPSVGDSLAALVQVVSDTYVVGVKISAPIVVMGFLSYVGFGIFNRLIPQLQAFFVAVPITVAIGLVMMAATLSFMMLIFMEELAQHLILFNITPNV